MMRATRRSADRSHTEAPASDVGRWMCRIRTLHQPHIGTTTIVVGDGEPDSDRLQHRAGSPTRRGLKSEIGVVHPAPVIQPRCLLVSSMSTSSWNLTIGADAPRSMTPVHGLDDTGDGRCCDQDVWSGRRDSNPRPSPWQGVAGYLAGCDERRDLQPRPARRPSSPPRPPRCRALYLRSQDGEGRGAPIVGVVNRTASPQLDSNPCLHLERALPSR